MSAKGFVLFVIVTSLLSLSIVFSFFWHIIWVAYGNYILAGLACLIVLKVVLNRRKTKHS